MRIFVTGASGWIGSATVPALQEAGHTVAALARSDASATRLAAADAEVVRGDIHDLDVVAREAAGADAVLHLAFDHDVAFGAGDFARAAASDRHVIEAMADAVAGTAKPFAIASGVFGLASGRVATEDDGRPAPGSTVPDLGGSFEDRGVTAQLVVGLAERGIRSSVVRLPPTCHGDGDGGFIATLAKGARASGAAAYVGDGSARWPATNRLDVARAFVLALEKAPAGSTLHAVAEEGVATRAIAEAIGADLGLPTESVDTDTAMERYGFIGMLLGVDSPASSARTRSLLGWAPTHPGLLEDIGAGYYRGAA